MRLSLSVLLAACVLWITACGESDKAASVAMMAGTPESAADDYYYEAGSDGVAYNATASRAEAGYQKVAVIPTNGPIAELPTAAQQRKIIYTGRVNLVVDDFEGVPASVSALAKKHGGFVASSSVRGSDGEPRRGDWTLRIPSANYDAFIEGSQTLGQVRELTSDSQEVTAEFVDLEARSRNLRAEEQRLHKHLEESTRSLKDILEVEREIARVRGEAERIEGRLNVLRDLTSLSTVTLTIEEIRDYVPAPTQEPGFGTQVARTWGASIDGVGGFFTRISLGVVGFVPWLVVVLPALVVAYVVLRGVRKHLWRQPRPSTTPVEA